LRRVVFNWSANARRAPGARSGHALEEAHVRGSTGDEVEHGELLRRVVDAVLALDEPYRTTILERYFRDRTAQGIAAESGTPLATVRSREQRALAQLRARLDREWGERSSWAFALFGLLRKGPAKAGPALSASRMFQAIA